MNNGEDVGKYIPQYISYCHRMYNLGKTMARVLLKGKIACDLTPENYGFREGAEDEIVILDGADIESINVPKALSPSNVHRITQSVMTCLASHENNFTFLSFFRAGFVSYGGLLGHEIFQNAANFGFSSIVYTKYKNAHASYDPSHLYYEAAKKAIKEWKHFCWENIDIGKYETLEKYEQSRERRTISAYNKCYLDDLYLSNCYLHFLWDFKRCPSNIPIVIYNWAQMAWDSRKYYSAYGLCEKCKLLIHKSQNSDYLAEHEIVLQCLESILQRLFQFCPLDPIKKQYVDNSIAFQDDDLFKLKWILSDLDNLCIEDDSENSQHDCNF